MVDQHGDNHGYMTLRIPADKITAGKTVTGKSYRKSVKSYLVVHDIQEGSKDRCNTEPFPGNIEKEDTLRCNLLKPEFSTSVSRLMQKFMPTETALKSTL